MCEKSGALAQSKAPGAQMSVQPPGQGNHPRNNDTAVRTSFAYNKVIDKICALNWEGLTRNDLMGVAWAYYYFSVQFRENLEIACKMYPEDLKLRQLEQGECHTDNLSPWPGVATASNGPKRTSLSSRTSTGPRPPASGTGYSPSTAWTASA